MSDVKITMNGRIYEIGCDPGQEGRIAQLAAYIDQKMQMIARSGAAYNDSHLFVLTSLVLADELFELQEQPAGAKTGAKGQQTAPATSKEDDVAVAKLIEQLTKRIDGIAAKVQAA